MANAFLCSLEEKLERDNKLPNLYKRYIDDTITAMPDVAGAEPFLSTLNECHPSISFNMELASNNKLPFLGMEIMKNGCQLSTSVYRKSTNTGLLLHFHSHVDRRYKTSLLRTMVDRAYRLSSTKELFEAECNKLRSIFSKLKYPNELVDSTILSFIKSKVMNISSPPPLVPVEQPVWILLPFKDQKSVFMKICRHGNQNNNEREFITVNVNKNIKNVKEFVYLGALITDNYDDNRGIR